MVVTVGGEKHWRFNGMDSESRLVRAADLSPGRTVRAAATALGLARERTDTYLAEVETDGLRSYRRALPRAFPTRRVKHGVSKGIRGEIDNNPRRNAGGLA